MNDISKTVDVADAKREVARMNALFRRGDAFKANDARPLSEAAQAIKARLIAAGVKLKWNARGFAKVIE